MKINHLSIMLMRLLMLVTMISLSACSGSGSEGGISGSGGPPKITVDGYAEKGPFLRRSEVTYRYVDRTGETVSEDFSTETTDDLGSFSLALEEQGLVSIRVRGYQFNEVTGQVSDGELTLRGLYLTNDAAQQHAQVNLLTHIIYDRVIAIAEGGATSAGLAMTQAEVELLGELETVMPDISFNDFSQLSIYNRSNTTSQGNAYLLLFSAALYQHAINTTPNGSSVSGQMTLILNALSDDFVDGDLEASGDILNGLALAIQQLDPDQVVSNLENRSSAVLGSALRVPDFSNFIGQFQITYPPDNANLSAVTPVRLFVPSGMRNVSLDLIIDGVVAETISEPPYEFSWDPYFWTSVEEENTRHSILVRAYNRFGAEIVSNLINVNVLANSRNQIELTAPEPDAAIENSDAVTLQWTAYAGAANYRVQVSDSSAFTSLIYNSTTTGTSLEIDNLSAGNYFWRIQLTDGNAHTGTWSNAMQFSISAPDTPQLSLPSNGTVLRDTTTPNLAWNAVNHASAYHIQISSNPAFNGLAYEQTVTTTQITTIPLERSAYYWRVKSIDSVGHESDYSAANHIDINGPLAPTNISSTWESASANYDVTIAWENSESSTSIEYVIAHDANFNQRVATGTAAGSSFLQNLGVGNYFIRMRSVNASGIGGDWSAGTALSAGLFQTRLGGSGYDSISTVIPSSQGGYIVLAKTASPEVATRLGTPLNGLEDWVIKLDDHGNVEWEHLSVMTGASKVYYRLTELSDGSIVLVGRDPYNNRATAVKLSINGDVQWSITHKPSQITNNLWYYYFNNVIEFGGQIYVTSGDGSPSCVSDCQFLDALSITDGSITNSVNIPNIPGITIKGVSNMEVLDNQKLLISGFATPTDLDPDTDPYPYTLGKGGAYIQILDENLTQIMRWNNCDDLILQGASGATRLRNGKFVVTGSTFLVTGDRITVVAADGLSHVNHWRYGHVLAGGILPISHDEILSVYEDENLEGYPRFWFTLNTNTGQWTKLAEFNDTGTRTIWKEDGTFIMFSQSNQNGNFDIVISKRINSIPLK